MEQGLADRSDEEELLDTKIWDMQLTDSRLQPSQLCL